MRMFGATGLIVLSVCMSLKGLMKLDKDSDMHPGVKEWGVLLAGSVFAAGIWSLTSADKAGIAAIFWLLIHIYFLSCSMTDSMTFQVYDVFQYMGVGTAGYLVLQNEGDIAIGVSILLFAMFQYFIFMRLYGKADGMAFLAASLAEGALGYDITMYLLHMIWAYLLLSLVQVVRGNIGSLGKLKKPVPFLPYIMISFWGILLFGERINTYI